LKLSELKDNEYFYTDSGVKWQKLPLITKNKTQQKIYKDRYKCKRLDTNEVFYLTNQIHVIKHFQK
jgi:hypothetical protein